ncbi:MAG: DUF4065 domain-containing protein [Defluviitaleaceae bacterium]|nr:DUF4065 domain-containing protein [Defluviitaleaceae bacterium]
MVTALNVANSILGRAFSENIQITPMKLQKLIYFTYKKYIKDTDGIPLFAERFEAWKHGPVVPSVYNEFNHYRANPIKRCYLSRDGKPWSVDESSSSFFHQSLNFVWENYKNKTGIELSILTHAPDTAWDKIIKGLNIKPYLNDDDIQCEGWLF